MLKTSSLKQMDDRGHGGLANPRERSESLTSRKSSSSGSFSSGETFPRKSTNLMSRNSSKGGLGGSLWGLAVKHAATQRRGPGRGLSLSYSASCVGKKPKQPEKYQNTYKLGPDKEFQPCRIEKVLEDVLENLQDHVYDASTCGNTARELSELVKRRVKDLNFTRYKIVSQVLIGSLSQGGGTQGIEIASRCVWNTDTDNFVSKNYKNSSLWAVAIVYGIYLD